MITMEKVTFNLPSDLKEKVAVLKDDMNVSMSFIYTDALRFYVEMMEKAKWKKAAEDAAKDSDYLNVIADLEYSGDDTYEY